MSQRFFYGSGAAAAAHLSEQEALKALKPLKGLRQNGTAATRWTTALGGADQQLPGPIHMRLTLEHRATGR